VKITIPEIPPSLNKYAGRANAWDYRAEKQRWLQLFVAYCPKCKPMGKAVVTITYYFPTRHRHDPDNYNGKMLMAYSGNAECGTVRTCPNHIRASKTIQNFIRRNC
jgi:hypothetical protein